MAKYSVTIELTKVECQRIEIDAKSLIDAHNKIKELMSSDDRCYSYLPLGNDETFKIESITQIEGYDD